MPFTRQDLDKIALDKLQGQTTPSFIEKIRQAAKTRKFILPKQLKT